VVGREGGQYAMDEMPELKWVTVQNRMVHEKRYVRNVY